MAIQWTIVCTQDVAPSVSGSSLDCSSGVLTVVPFKYLSEDEQSLGSLMSLSSENATAISFAIIGVWAIAWGIKQAIRALNIDRVQNEDD
jgi:hypothetical protein